MLHVAVHAAAHGVVRGGVTGDAVGPAVAYAALPLGALRFGCRVFQLCAPDCGRISMPNASSLVVPQLAALVASCRVALQRLLAALCALETVSGPNEQLRRSGPTTGGSYSVLGGRPSEARRSRLGCNIQAGRLPSLRCSAVPSGAPNGRRRPPPVAPPPPPTGCLIGCSTLRRHGCALRSTPPRAKAPPPAAVWWLRTVTVDLICTRLQPPVTAQQAKGHPTSSRAPRAMAVATMR